LPRLVFVVIGRNALCTCGCAARVCEDLSNYAAPQGFSSFSQAKQQCKVGAQAREGCWAPLWMLSTNSLAVERFTTSIDSRSVSIELSLGSTPLMEAAREGHDGIVIYLLQLARARNQQGQTGLELQAGTVQARLTIEQTTRAVRSAPRRSAVHRALC